MTKTTQEFVISGKEMMDQIMDEVKKVVKAGTTRKIIVKTESGEEIAQFMLPVGLGLLIMLPVLSGLAVVVAMISKCTIVLEKEEETAA